MRKRGTLRNEILDSDEQLNVINTLKSEATLQEKFFRKVFFCLFLLLVAGYIFLSISFLFDPWVMVHQEIFHPSLSAHFFLSFYVVSIIVALSSALRCLFGPLDKLKYLWYMSVLISILCLIVWMDIFFRYSITSLILYWMPFGNFVSVLLAWYIDSELSSMYIEIGTLNSLMYNCKGV